MAHPSLPPFARVRQSPGQYWTQAGPVLLTERTHLCSPTRCAISFSGSPSWKAMLEPEQRQRTARMGTPEALGMSLVFSPTPQNQTLETLLTEATCTLSRDRCTHACSQDAYDFRKSTEAPSKNPHFNHCSPLLSQPDSQAACSSSRFWSSQNPSLAA